MHRVRVPLERPQALPCRGAYGERIGAPPKDSRGAFIGKTRAPEMRVDLGSLERGWPAAPHGSCPHGRNHRKPLVLREAAASPVPGRIPPVGPGASSPRSSCGPPWGGEVRKRVGRGWRRPLWPVMFERSRTSRRGRLRCWPPRPAQRVSLGSRSLPVTLARVPRSRRRTLASRVPLAPSDCRNRVVTAPGQTDERERPIPGGHSRSTPGSKGVRSRAFRRGVRSLCPSQGDRPPPAP